MEAIYAAKINSFITLLFDKNKELRKFPNPLPSRSDPAKLLPAHVRLFRSPSSPHRLFAS